MVASFRIPVIALDLRIMFLRRVLKLSAFGNANGAHNQGFYKLNQIIWLNPQPASVVFGVPVQKDPHTG